jgi:hypothetical protein
MKVRLTRFILIGVLLAGAGFAGAQTTGMVSAVKQQNIFLLNGRPQLLFWARGLHRPQELPAYEKSGFTALYVGITASEASLSQAKALLAAAQADGFPVIVGIDSRAAQLDAKGAITVAVSPGSPAYQTAVRTFLSRVVTDLGSNSNVIAWIVENLAADQIVYGNPDYQRWLQQQYRDLPKINNIWGADFIDSRQITLEQAARIDADRPGGLGRAALSRGFYYQGRFRELLGLWAGSLRQLDQQRPIILGGQTDYRSLMAPMEPVAGQVTLVCAPRPSTFGGWSGIEAIDIARQANRFAAFAFADVRAGVSGGALYDWAGQCLVHGAAGIGLEDWDSIKAQPDLLSALLKINHRYIITGAFPRTPQAETAFIYVPMAGGPIYGFMPQTASAEPGVLFRAFARGTRFGGVDYLSEETVPQADLSRYATIFAPLAFAVYDDSQTALENYVQAGGVLVADWGFALNDGGSLNYLPEKMSQLFGVGDIWSYYRPPLDIAVDSPDELFPSLTFNATTSGEAEGSAFSGLVGDPVLLGGAKRLLTRFVEVAFAPTIVLNRFGEGYGIFAAAALWENWRRGDDLFEAFHRDLIGRSRGLTAVQEGLFPEADTIRYGEGGVGVYRPADLSGATAVHLAEAGNRVYFLSSGYQVLGDNPALVFFGSGGNSAFPLALQAELTGTVYLQVKEYGAKKIVLELHGPGALISSEGGAVSLSGGEAFTLNLTLKNGATYNVTDGSRHLLTIKSLAEEVTATRQLTASEGALAIKLSGSAMEMTLTPVE